jgi:hypothetical protein
MQQKMKEVKSMSEESERIYYYPYRCLPSTQVRGRRPQHAEGFCGRPMLRKSKERLPIQGSPCPNCGRRTRINEENLDFGYLEDVLAKHGQNACHVIEVMKEIHEDELIYWKEHGDKRVPSSKYSNISEETITELEYVADGLEQFVKECEQKEARGEYE